MSGKNRSPPRSLSRWSTAEPGVAAHVGTIPVQAGSNAPVWQTALLHGLRTGAAVSIALGLAFWLELDNAYWAGTTAAIVCQPVLGSSLRKALFRTYGTFVGATAAVLLWAIFPQDRVGFCLGLASWCAVCGFLGHRLTFFAAYGAQLAGYTAVIIAGDVIGHPDLAFLTVLARVSEIELGIAVATIILSTTQPNRSRERLAAALDALACDALGSLRGLPIDTNQLLLRLVDLDSLIDHATGEAVHWRLNLQPIRTARNGLFGCIAAAELLRSARQTGSWWALLPQAVTVTSCRTAENILLAMSGPEPRMAAGGAAGVATALETAAWLRHPSGALRISGSDCPAPADPLPALITAGRVYLSIAAASVMWMATAWPNGPGAITWTVIPILLMSPLHERAFHAAAWFAAGTALTAVLACALKFTLLPAFSGFWGLSAALGLVLVPLAALSVNNRLTSFIGPATVNLIPFVAPANQMIYDTTDFYNSALSILAGCTIAAVALRVIGPLPAHIRTRRVLAAALADCDALAAGVWDLTAAQWTDRMRTRTSSLSPAAGPAAIYQALFLFGRGIRAIHQRDTA